MCIFNPPYTKAGMPTFQNGKVSHLAGISPRCQEGMEIGRMFPLSPQLSGFWEASNRVLGGHVLAHFEPERIRLVTTNVLFLIILQQRDFTVGKW